MVLLNVYGLSVVVWWCLLFVFVDSCSLFVVCCSLIVVCCVLCRVLLFVV